MPLYHVHRASRLNSLSVPPSISPGTGLDHVGSYYSYPLNQKYGVAWARAQGNAQKKQGKGKGKTARRTQVLRSSGPRSQVPGTQVKCTPRSGLSSPVNPPRKTSSPVRIQAMASGMGSYVRGRYPQVWCVGARRAHPLAVDCVPSHRSPCEGGTDARVGRTAYLTGASASLYLLDRSPRITRLSGRVTATLKHERRDRRRDA